MFRSLVNFLVLTAEERPAREDPVILARFVVILLVGFFVVTCAVILIRTQGMMAFRVGGALESLQAQYFMLNLCFSMLTFDLQAQLCLCVLILTSGLYASLQHSLILVVGVLWAVLKVTIGILAILRELKVLVWIFLVQNVPEVAYLFYLLYTQSLGPGQLVHWRSGGHRGLVHLCGHQVCLALGPVPRVSKLWPGSERENVFFLWKDRVLSSPQTSQGPRAGAGPGRRPSRFCRLLSAVLLGGALVVVFPACGSDVRPQLVLCQSPLWQGPGGARARSLQAEAVTGPADAHAPRALPAWGPWQDPGPPLPCCTTRPGAAQERRRAPRRQCISLALFILVASISESLSY
ncbi:uncharacterized protein LOC141564262 isoform X2 [Sminthopsis crassicaudata]